MSHMTLSATLTRTLPACPCGVHSARHIHYIEPIMTTYWKMGSLWAPRGHDDKGLGWVGLSPFATLIETPIETLSGPQLRPLQGPLLRPLQGPFETPSIQCSWAYRLGLDLANLSLCDQTLLNICNSSFALVSGTRRVELIQKMPSTPKIITFIL